MRNTFDTAHEQTTHTHANTTYQCQGETPYSWLLFSTVLKRTTTSSGQISLPQNTESTHTVTAATQTSETEREPHTERD